MFRAVDEALFGLPAALMSWLLIKSRQLQEKTMRIFQQGEETTAAWLGKVQMFQTAFSDIFLKPHAPQKNTFYY